MKLRPPNERELAQRARLQERIDTRPMSNADVIAFWPPHLPEEDEKLRAEKAAAGAIDVPLPEATVPWPTVTRYSGGASHEGIGDRVWVRLKDDGSEVEYMPVDSVVKPAPVLLTDEEIQELFMQCASDDDVWKTRAIEAAVLKKNRLR